MRKTIVQLIALLTCATLVTGCNKGDNDKETKRGESNQTKKEAQVADNVELINQIKSKYAASENVQYKDPMYNLPKDQTFVYENVSDNVWSKDVYSYLEVYYDAELTKPVTIELVEDPDNHNITLKPQSTFNYEGDEGTTHVMYCTWGTRSKFYLVQKYDFEADKMFDKPQVTVFTIKQDLTSPTLTQSVSENGYYQLEWSSVKEADYYEVYRYDVSLDYAELEFTTESTSCLSSDFKTTKDHEERFRERYKDTEIDVDKQFTMNNMIMMDTGYFVVAKTEDGRKSGMSNTCVVDDIAGMIPISKQLGQDYKFEGDTALVLPAYTVMEMLDGSTSKMVIEYHGAQVTLYEDGLIGIEAKIRNLPIEGVILYLSGMEYEDFLEDVKKVTEREDKIIVNGSRQKTEMDIPYVPADDTQEPEETKPELETESEPQTEVETEKKEETTHQANETGKIELNDDIDSTIYANNSLSEWIALNMLHHEETISLADFPEASSTESLQSAVLEAYNQNPLIDFVTYLNYDYNQNAIIVKYIHTKEESEKMQKDSLEAAAKIANEIVKDGMSDYEKEEAINNYLCENCEYNEEILNLINEDGTVAEDATEKYPNSFLPYGILVEKVGVCESYSEAFLLIAKNAGLDAVIETGRLSGVNHEWNRVKIDGSWCIIDVTNNDNPYFPNAYFNLTEETSQGLLIPDKDVIVPEKYNDYIATNGDYEYYKQNNKCAKDCKEATDMISDILQDGKVATVRVESEYTESELQNELSQLLTDIGASEANYQIYAGILRVELQ